MIVWNADNKIIFESENKYCLNEGDTWKTMIFLHDRKLIYCLSHIIEN